MDTRHLNGESIRISPRYVLPLYAIAVLLLGMAGKAGAQSEPAPAVADKPVLEEVVVTGRA
jgi:hypothetical protein